MVRFRPHFAKTWKYPSDIRQFSKLRVLQKVFEEYSIASIIFARKSAGIFVLGHNLKVQSSQFSSSYALGKLFASPKR